VTAQLRRPWSDGSTAPLLHPLELLERLIEIARGENAESQIPEAPGDRQRAGAAHERLVQLAEI